MIDNPITDKLNKTQFDNQRLKSEISVIKDSSLEIEKEWSCRFSQLEMKFQEVSKERDSLNEKKKTLEQSLVLMAAENERLMGIISEQEQQYQTFYSKMEKQKSTVDVEGRLRDATLECETWRIK